MNPERTGWMAMLGVLVLAGAIAALIFTPTKRTYQAIVNPPPEAFVVESGPQTVGYKELYVVRHSETGRRFVLVMGDGPVAIAPLDGAVFEFRLGPAHDPTTAFSVTNWLIHPVYTSQYLTNINQ